MNGIENENTALLKPEENTETLIENSLEGRGENPETLVPILPNFSLSKSNYDSITSFIVSRVSKGDYIKDIKKDLVKDFALTEWQAGKIIVDTENWYWKSVKVDKEAMRAKLIAKNEILTERVLTESALDITKQSDSIMKINTNQSQLLNLYNDVPNVEISFQSNVPESVIINQINKGEVNENHNEQ